MGIMVLLRNGVVGVCFHDVVDEIVNLFAIAIVVINEGISVKFGTGFVQKEIIHVLVPHVGVLP